MKFLAFLGKSALATTAVAAGLGTGNWVNEQVHTPQTHLSTAHMEEDTPESPLGEPASAESLFHYQFIPGETLYYALDATVGGSGIESLTGPGSVAMEFTSDMHVHTESIDLLGNGTIEIAFDQVQMNGSFMDAPVNLTHSMAGTEFSHGNDSLSTAQGDSTAGIPQLDFFNTPTRALVSPAGEVLQVYGAPGMDQLLSPQEIVTSVEFPAGDLDAGAQWTSDFAMPVPGLGAGVASTATNVLEGFQLFRGRYCGVVRQTILSSQEDGTLASPESALGEEMNFSLPEFKLRGENLIYFDVDNGQLVQAEMNLDFTMRIGDQLKPMADMMNLYGKLLNEIEGNAPGESDGEDLLDLGINIQATLALLTE